MHELLTLYAETNSKVLAYAEKHGTLKSLPLELKDATAVLCQMLELLGNLKLDMRHPFGINKDLTFNDYYQPESFIFSPDKRVLIMDSKNN